ncbi:hypothetical protein BpHYR1_000796 [Brachionus plicatilis]|uniref:Uncharacterized protein n=1 Tax=Brachionus plicatilis TaxID=10195 RepID=A0A3M7P9H9_BRAPC|nr:hypothetical protein BpHYR1_000796 [Brachionus plicatilis]
MSTINERKKDFVGWSRSTICVWYLFYRLRVGNWIESCNIFIIENSSLILCCINGVKATIVVFRI